MISLCMIVKNESKTLERCINSVKEKFGKYVNDFVVVDTGSTDNTVEIAEKLGCRVYDFEWCNDFSKARNFSSSMAKNDWILSLDADEYIEKIDIREVAVFLKNNDKSAVGLLDIQNLAEDGMVFSGGIIVRIYNRRRAEFTGKIHEHISPKKGNKINNMIFNIIINHTGYSDEAWAEKNKLEMYKKMTEEALIENPNDYQSITHLGSLYKGLKEFDKAVECYEKVVFNEKCVELSYYNIAVNEYIKTLIQLEQYSVAKVCENLWNICSHDDGYVYLMGYVYAQLGEAENAVDCFLNCINRTGPMKMDKSFSYYPLGSILEKLGDLEQALICYKAVGTFNNAHLKVKEIEEKLKLLDKQ